MASLHLLMLLYLLANRAVAIKQDPWGPLHIQDDLYYEQFPADFAWSTATAAYQIEGGWKTDGKGRSIWDDFSHQGRIDNNATGDVACDSYHLYNEDIKLISNMKAAYYRFSIAWTRIFPNGTKQSRNQKGIDYYNNVINTCLAANIIPMVTLYHWDLPSRLQENGGWENGIMVEYFEDYANMCFKEFGDRVKFWITFNEPRVISRQGYEVGTMAPGIKGHGDKLYKVTHNILKAHAAAYKKYQREYKASQRGQVGITLNTDWQIPYDGENPADQAAAETAIYFMLGWFTEPLFKGDYPTVMKELIANKSASGQSRLPTMTTDDKSKIQGSMDFLGINFYTSNLVRHKEYNVSTPSYDTDSDTELTKNSSWPSSGSSWLKVTPIGIRRMLNWINVKYGNVTPIYITENGISDRTGSLDDTDRIHYYQQYINNVLKAIRLDGVNVKGYTAWSLMDNFEWMRGYTERFGLHYVNFTDPKRPRIPKASARYYKKLIENNGFVHVTSGSVRSNDISGCRRFLFLAVSISAFIALF